ncbi:MAG: redoxin domain-containing protein [Deltaproteobacteria bacterium]|nr:redoxin domain-containing protein [Deltaproteobacteria bacterium]
MKKANQWRMSSIFFSCLFLGMISVASAVEVGEKAPDFELTSTKNGKIKLSGFQGKKNVVIQFYVLDFTPT